MREAHTQRDDAGRRGVALIIAVAVLTALFLLGVPFAVFMRMQHSASTQAVQTARAEAGRHGGLNHTKKLLYQGVNEPGPFPFEDADVDTLWERRVRLRTTVDSYSASLDTQILTVNHGLGFPNDGNLNTVDGYLRVDEEWLAYNHVQELYPHWPTAELVVRPWNRGLFGTSEQTPSPGATVSVFPERELWHTDIDDEQGKINVNTAPFLVIVNLLGYLGIGEGASPPAPYESAFPDDRQWQIAWAISQFPTGYGEWNTEDTIPDSAYTPFQNLSMLKNVSYASGESWFTTDPLTADELDRLRPHLTVISEFVDGQQWLPVFLDLDADITDSPTPATPETAQWAANLDDAKRVAVGTVVRFVDSGSSPSDLRFRSVISRNDDALIVVPANAGDETLRVDDASRYQRLEDNTRGYVYIEGANPEWISYTGVDTSGSPHLLTGIQHDPWGTPTDGLQSDHADDTNIDGGVVSWRETNALPQNYSADDPDHSVHVENRHPVNINMVDDPVTLASIVNGISDGTNSIEDASGDLEASSVARNILSRVSGESLNGPYDFFDGPDDETWFGDRGELDVYLDTDFSEPSVESAGGATTDGADLEDDDGTLLQDNFSLTPGNWPPVSTVPLRLNSPQLMGIRSLSSVDNRARTPVAQLPRGAGLEVGRKYKVYPPLAPIWFLLRTQKEFVDESASPGENILTTVLNEYLSEADLLADSEDRYVDPAPGIGGAAPEIDAVRPVNQYVTAVEGLHETESGNVPSFDLDPGTHGTAAEQGGAVPDTTNTTAHGVTAERLSYFTDYQEAAGSRNWEADSFHATIQPFAVDFWIRPGEDTSSRQMLLDLGKAGYPAADADANQMCIYLEDDAVKLRIDDEIGETGTYGGYVEAVSSSDFSMESGVWHHVAVAAVGTFRHEIAMFIDGIYDRNMSWSHSGGGQEGYFWPIGIETSNEVYTIESDVNNSDLVPLVESTANLPPQGMVVIGAGSNPYEYTANDTANNILTLTQPVTYPAGTQVAPMIPLRRTDIHANDALLPTIGDEVTLWAHQDPAGTGAYVQQLSGGDTYYGPVQVQSVEDSPVTPALQPYTWIGFNPGDFPLGAAPVTTFDRGDRWKVLNHTAFSAAGPALAGDLPCGPSGPEFRICETAFEGDLDEVRVTALPAAYANVPGGWASPGATPLTLTHWHWVQDVALGDTWWRVSPTTGAYHPTASPAMPTSGGYFAGADIDQQMQLYSYQEYDTTTGELRGVRRLNDDLTPTGQAGVGPVRHPDSARIIPLNFITAGRLSANYNIGDGDVPLVDASQFPSTGYVSINTWNGTAVDEEIIAYDSISADDLVRPVNANGISPYPRGAYDSTETDHLTDDIVRYVPARYLDRYSVNPRGGGPDWGNHILYTDAELTSDMCMLSHVESPAADSELYKIQYELKEPLQANQKLVVLVNLDPWDPVAATGIHWNTHPSDDVDSFQVDSDEEGDRRDYIVISEDALYGAIIEDPDPADTDEVRHGVIHLYSKDPDTGIISRPTVGSHGVHVRHYFDISGSTRAPVEQPIELDLVGIELVAEPQTF